MNWTAFTYGAVEHDLSHLDEFAYDLVVPSKDNKPAQSYSLNVSFSIHCFTRAPKIDEAVVTELAYSDSRETRVFDFDRYEQSKGLPAIVRELGRRKCYHDKHGNFYVFEAKDSDGLTVYYSVFFTLSKAGKKQGLNMYVTTAHTRPEPPYAKSSKPIRFDVIVHNIWTGKKIKAPA